MVQPSLAARSHSFDLVRNEIEQTIKQAETGLERFQENRNKAEELQNCIDYLNQLRGIFILVELQGASRLCQEAAILSDDIPAGDDANPRLTALSGALFILRRYVEYYHQQREDHPELLLPAINELRVAGGQAPHPESWFFTPTINNHPDFCTDLPMAPLAEDGQGNDVLSRRMRLTFQVALLGILKERNPEVSKKLLARAARGFARLSQGTPQGQLWCLVTIVANTMVDRAMGFTKARKRLLMQLERSARNIVYMGPTAMEKAVSDSLFIELLYLLYRSGSANPEVVRVLDAYQLAPSKFPDSMMEAHARRLYGPGSDVLKSLSQALQEELNKLKDRLDIIERGLEPDLSELSEIADGLESIANTLVMLDLTQLANLARDEASRLRQGEADDHMPDEDELYRVAGSVLAIENATLQFVNRGITTETDAMAAAANNQEASIYLQEAVWVVADEARSALTLAKRAITAFLESDYDKLHLANLPGTLHSIWGGLEMISDSQAATVISRIAASIQEQLLDAREAPSEQVLESLADALTSLEYYIESIGREEERNPDLLKLAESALDGVGL